MAEFGAWLFFHQVDFHIHPPELEGASKSPGSAAGHNGDNKQILTRLLFCPFTHSRVLCVSIMFIYNNISQLSHLPAGGMPEVKWAIKIS